MVGHVVAIGGGGLTPGDPLDDFVLSLAARERPQVAFLPTASGDDADYVARFYDALFGRDAIPSHVSLFGAPERPADRVRAADVVYVGGGNTANLLALWRLHGIDAAVAEVWERGGVLAGVSAGANCSFEAYVTDSFGLELSGSRDGLGLVPGSFCPHFDGEERRRPVYRSLVAGGFPAGIACDDFAAAWFEGTKLREIVASQEGARGYRVTADGEEPLPARTL